MIKYTTPAINLVIKGVTFDGTERVWVTIRQSSTTITIEDPTVDITGTDPVINLVLTQEQTASLALGNALFQVNWMTSDDVRGATDIVNIEVTRNLLDVIKTYEDAEEVSNG